MKVGERGQVTIPKDIRNRFGLWPHTEVEFHVEKGAVVLRKSPRKLNLEAWKGRLKARAAELGYKSVDKFMKDVRGG